MQEHAAALNGQQVKVLTALLAGSTIEAAATAAGINAATIHRWLGQPSFVAAYRDSRTRALLNAIAALQLGAATVVAELRMIATDRSIAPGTRVQAARAFLDLTLRGSEVVDLAERIEQLEAAAADRTALAELEAEHES